MKTILMAAFAALAFVTSALAGEEAMASRYGNTTQVTMANGDVVKIWYNADHSWTGDQAGTAIGGTWKIDGDKLCVSWNNPPANVTNPTCAPAVARAVGETWTVGEGASQMTARLVAGH